MHLPDTEGFDPARIDYVVCAIPPTGLLASLSRLRAVFSLGAGVDRIRADELPMGVPLVRFVHPELTQQMTQYCVMHSLIHHRRQRQLDAAQAEHRWSARVPTSDASTRVGILGLGEIGTSVAVAVRDLGFRVAGWSRQLKQIEGIESYSGVNGLNDLFGQSDILICTLPLTPDTRYILDASAFARLPRGAFIINVARGEHLVESDLLAALDSGHLGGAALDVFEIEPLPPQSPLWSHPLITVTPHVSGVVRPAVQARQISEDIFRHWRGEPLRNVVDGQRGY